MRRPRSEPVCVSRPDPMFSDRPRREVRACFCVGGDPCPCRARAQREEEDRINGPLWTIINRQREEIARLRRDRRPPARLKGALGG